MPSPVCGGRCPGGGRGSEATREETMLSKADNEFLTRSGKDTPMGELLRRFWMGDITGLLTTAAACVLTNAEQAKFKGPAEAVTAIHGRSEDDPEAAK